jgi:holin-like protein
MSRTLAASSAATPPKSTKAPRIWKAWAVYPPDMVRTIPSPWHAKGLVWPERQRKVPHPMLHAILLILTCQLVGEVAARASGLPLPGPVIGLVLALGLMIALPKVADVLRPTASGLLAHLSLLFVPAGVGVVGHIATLGNQTFAILLAVVASTAIAIAVGALTFDFVARLTGSTDA